MKEKISAIALNMFENKIKGFFCNTCKHYCWAIIITNRATAAVGTSEI